MLGSGNQVLQPRCSDKMCPSHQFYKTPNPRQAEELSDEWGNVLTGSLSSSVQVAYLPLLALQRH